MGQGELDTTQFDTWKAQLDAQVKLKVEEIKQETALQIALLNAEDKEDVTQGNEDMKALVDNLQASVAALQDAHKQAQEGLLEAVTKPKVTKATAKKQADGTWQLIKEEV